MEFWNLALVNVSFNREILKLKFHLCNTINFWLLEMLAIMGIEVANENIGF